MACVRILKLQNVVRRVRTQPLEALATCLPLDQAAYFGGWMRDVIFAASNGTWAEEAPLSRDLLTRDNHGLIESRALFLLERYLGFEEEQRTFTSSAQEFRNPTLARTLEQYANLLLLHLLGP
ncbi:hypothetical protein VNO77_41831 [Canavalia gladiata]|uniref:Uncharacterized protein n=1 Tax=Canavalia gladiata TaxID=3824 RepID=A0AAN9JZ61_CANGL